MQNIKKYHTNKGFSLVELSVSLAIIGMIAGSAISVAVTSDYYTKKSETESKLDRIEESIAGFLQSNLRLPCVADGTLTSTSIQYGIEGTMTPAAGGVVACPNKNFNSGFINAGVVPMRTLQLPDDYMFDGWGRRITYVVDYRFVNNTTTNTTCDGTTSTVCFIDTANGSLTVNDAAGSARTSTAVYVLISHGENGHGAFTKNGSATRINAFPAGNPYRNDSPAEMENAELDNAGADTAYDATFVQKDFIREDSATDANREYFDDILRFKNKQYLVKSAGKVTYDSICRDASNIVTAPGSNNCTGAANEENCESMATEVYLRCLQ